VTGRKTTELHGGMNDMEILNIFKSETKKMLIIQKRYFLNFLVDMLVYYFVFMGLYIP